MPFWIFVMSKMTSYMGADVSIPYTEIARTLMFLVIPCFLGVGFNKWRPKMGRVVIHATKYVAYLFILFQLIANGFVNRYMFDIILVYPRIVGAIILLPICGFGGGYAMAAICRQKRSAAITIALETSIQNIAIAIIMLMTSFGLPEGDLGSTIPVLAGYLTIVPLCIIMICLSIYRYVKNKQNGGVESEEDGEKECALMESGGIKEDLDTQSGRDMKDTNPNV